MDPSICPRTPRRSAPRMDHEISGGLVFLDPVRCGHSKARKLAGGRNPRLDKENFLTRFVLGPYAEYGSSKLVALMRPAMTCMGHLNRYPRNAPPPPHTGLSWETCTCTYPLEPCFFYIALSQCVESMQPTYSHVCSNSLKMGIISYYMRIGFSNLLKKCHCPPLKRYPTKV